MSTVEAPASHLPLPMQNILSRLAANSTEAEQALAVAEVLAELGFDAHSVAAGLLHDTVEDTKVTLKRLTPSSANRSPTSWTA